MLIDSKNIILGRLASFAAKHALLGENVDIVNCERAVITGNKKRTLRDYNERLDRGSKAKGPFVNKRPDMFVKRVIRGMLPYRKENGKKALKRIKCYIGVPDNFKNVINLKETDGGQLRGYIPYNQDKTSHNIVNDEIVKIIQEGLNAGLEWDTENAFFKDLPTDLFEKSGSNYSERAAFKNIQIECPKRFY